MHCISAETSAEAVNLLPHMQTRSDVLSSRMMHVIEDLVSNSIKSGPRIGVQKVPLLAGSKTALAPGGAGQGCAAGASAVAWEGALSVRRGF